MNINPHNSVQFEMQKNKPAFSLIEMLMALLVASLLMAALAPVMVKKSKENVSLTGEVNAPKLRKHEINYLSTECQNVLTDADGSQYCEGTFTIPTGVNGSMTITVVGAGSGGAAASTAGSVEYTIAGSTRTFTVPVSVNEIEATLISGGAGGGAGGQVSRSEEWINSGTYTWNVPLAVRGKNTLITGCGAGGGGGGSLPASINDCGAGAGGTGATVANYPLVVNNVASLDVRVAQSAGVGQGGAASYFGNLLALAGGGAGGYGGHVGSIGTASASGVTPSPNPIGSTGGAGGSIIWSNFCANGVTNNCFSGSSGAGGLPGGTTSAVNTDYHTVNYCGAARIAPTSSLSPYCVGGRGGGSGLVSLAGAAGYMKVSYLDYGIGASGGGSGSVYTNTNSVTKIKTVPAEILNLTIGTGGIGGTAGAINAAGVTTSPTSGSGSTRTILSRGATELANSLGACANGNCPGAFTGAVHQTTAPFTGLGGAINGIDIGANGRINGAEHTSWPGFWTSNGRTAGDIAQVNFGPFANATLGGRGGAVKTPWFTCIPGLGGTTGSPDGGNGDRGCGGGGGYGLGNGGKGGDGYARISWNKAWNNAANSYTLSQGASGGGGASGNILKYKIEVKSGETIKIRIGKGGVGGYISNNAFVVPKIGGTTQFGVGRADVLKAGGGLSPTNPTISGANMVNGKGGGISSTCHIGGASGLNDSAICTKGAKGEDATNTTGGNGANLTNIGTGGATRSQGSGLTDGQDADGIGAGGGGAALKDVGMVLFNESINNPTKGGNGTNGKIIIEWYE